MNHDAEQYLLNIFLNSPNYQIWLPDHIDTICNTFNVVEKQIYATLYKWDKKGWIEYGTSIRRAWLTKSYLTSINYD